MRVKVFQGWGHTQVQALEKKINDWLEAIESEGLKVQHVQTAAAGTGTSQEGDEIVQAVVITVWYSV
jgi:hypothetical protein